MKNSRKIIASLIIVLGVSGTALAQDGVSPNKQTPTTDKQKPTFNNDGTNGTTQDLNGATPNQTTTSDPMVTPQDPSMAKTPMKLEEVPMAVRDGLMDNGYEATAVGEVYKVKKEKSTYYEFLVEKEGKTWALLFDHRGNYVTKKEVG